MPLIKSIEMFNFKCYKHKKIEFSIDQVNEIFGQNGVGKTSILDAIKFCIFGSKKDVNKIKKDYIRCKVITIFKDKNNEITISSNLDNIDKKYSCEIYLNGNKIKSPSTYIKQLFSIDSFDPKTILSDNEKLLSLINIEFPKDELNKIPSKYLENYRVDTDSKSFKEIINLKKHLEQERRFCFREKSQKENTYKELLVQFDNEKKNIKSLKENENLESLKNIEMELKVSYEKQKANLEKIYLQKLSEIQLKIKESEKIQHLVEKGKIINKLNDDMENSIENYKQICNIIKVNIKEMIIKSLIPIVEKVKGLEYDDDQFKFNNVPLSELSNSEKISLSLNLISIKENKTLVVCDNMECFDSKSINKINWENLNALIFRVGENKNIINSNAIEIKKDEQTI